jgi:hypothetical protein
VPYHVFGLVPVALADHASFRLILLLLARFVCVNCFLSTNLSSFLLPGRRLLLLLCCLVYLVCFAAWFIQLSHDFGSTCNLCVPMGDLRGEGWVDPSHCFYVQVQVRRPRWHRHSDRHMTVGLGGPFWHNTTDWELWCDQPQVPWSCVSLCIYINMYILLRGVEWGPWAVIPMAGA